SVAAAAAWFARRNARLDRGDRRGAARVAGAVFVASFAAALLALHPALIGDVSSLVPILFVPAGLTGLAWILYLAFEPYFRRHYPDLLVSWTRLVGGRFGDPLVGRAVLGGLLLGCASVLPLVAVRPRPALLSGPALVVGVLWAFSFAMNAGGENALLEIPAGALAAAFIVAALLRFGF